MKRRPRNSLYPGYRTNDRDVESDEMMGVDPDDVPKLDRAHDEVWASESIEYAIPDPLSTNS